MMAFHVISASRQLKTKKTSLAPIGVHSLLFCRRSPANVQFAGRPPCLRGRKRRGFSRQPNPAGTRVQTPAGRRSLRGAGRAPGDATAEGSRSWKHEVTEKGQPGQVLSISGGRGQCWREVYRWPGGHWWRQEEVMSLKLPGREFFGWLAV